MAHIAHLSTDTLIALLKSSDPSGQLPVRILSSSEIAIGLGHLKHEVVIDFSSEKIIATEGSSPPKPLSHSPQTKYWARIVEHLIEANVLRLLLRDSLLCIERLRPGTLEKLGKIKTGTKRIIAHDPKSLFDSEHLSSTYSEKLSDDWWLGTNNSAQETAAWLRRAAECAGFRWRDDIECWFD